MRTAIVSLCALLVAPPAFAQSEAALKEFFEGKRVVVSLDMPATQSGVDVYADARRPLNFDEYSARLKTTGIAIRSGESVVITKIKLKDKLIEFHLAGGGFGTMGDDTNTSVYLPSAPKTTREKNLEREVKSTMDAAAKRRLQQELDDLKKDRAREDVRNNAVAAAASEEKKRRIAEQRLHGGSRFNIRYQTGVPSGVTPEGIMAALSEYVDFRPGEREAPAAQAAPAPRLAPAANAPRKGMTWQEARAAFGEPDKSVDRMEGSFKVTTAIFSRDDQRIEAEFVEGVLIRYSISSK